MRLWAAAHAIDDMYQGLVPASVPYFVLDRHYSYVAASGLGVAMFHPAAGTSARACAGESASAIGIGAGLSGLASAYPVVWVLLLASGLAWPCSTRPRARRREPARARAPRP